MRRKKIVGCFLCLSIVFQSFLTMGCTKKEVKIYDHEGEILAGLQTFEFEKANLKDKEYRAYLEIVHEEAIHIVRTIEKCGSEDAEKLILGKQYHIYTNFDKNIYQSIKKTYKEEYKRDDVSLGCAVTDNRGNLLAAYGTGDIENGYRNYATIPVPPYSSFKPLSVYAPSIEKGVTSWSKTYADSPAKQIAELDGTMRDWPANANNQYSNEKVSVCDAIKYSLNTVAVKCLQEYGVANSMNYLKENFNMPLPYEEQLLNVVGEEEVLGNIALGYLYAGVSPVNMAGYYQVFANGGTYIEPRTVAKICDDNGNVIYELEPEGKRVMSVETAFVMNQLLQGVVSRGGTGNKAYFEGVPIGGKTGTGTKGNWFIGFTPEYTCAVWHGQELKDNHAADIFSKIVSQFPHSKEASFPECETVKTSAYCIESGMLFSESCQKIDKGYYTSIDTTERCNIH